MFAGINKMVKNVLRVNIFGTEYPIKGDMDAEYILKVASFVDSKMREIDKNIAIKSSLKVAILAALNIADELFKERMEKEKVLNDMESKAMGISKYLEENLEKIQ
jgi:cell division protein ZapA